MIEPEIAFCDLHETMNLAEAYVSSFLKLLYHLNFSFCFLLVCLNSHSSKLLPDVLMISQFFKTLTWTLSWFHRCMTSFVPGSRESHTQRRSRFSTPNVQMNRTPYGSQHGERLWEENTIARSLDTLRAVLYSFTWVCFLVFYGYEPAFCCRIGQRHWCPFTCAWMQMAKQLPHCLFYSIRMNLQWEANEKKD